MNKKKIIPSSWDKIMNRETFDSLETLFDDYNYFHNFYMKIDCSQIKPLTKDIIFPFKYSFWQWLLKINNFLRKKLFFWKEVNKNNFYCLNQENLTLKEILATKIEFLFEIVLTKNNYFQFEKVLIFQSLQIENLHYFEQGALIFQLISVHKLDLISICQYTNFSFDYLEKIFLLFNFDEAIKIQFLEQKIPFKMAELFLKIKNNQDFILEILKINKIKKFDYLNLEKKIIEFMNKSKFKKLNIVKFNNSSKKNFDFMVSDILKLNLEKKLKTKILIKEHEIKIFYENLEDLRRIIKKIAG